ncbi:MAG: kynureninase [Solirubrobacteraceae bacterium]
MRSATSSPDAAAALDGADPLRHFRDRFVTAADDPIYLDGNSLGRLPLDTPAKLEQVLRNGWGSRMIRAWSEGWLELPLRIGDRIGAELLGAGAGQVAVADSTTVCLYKLASAAIAARPGRREIVTDRYNFPTDRYVLESLAADRRLTIRWIEADPGAGPTPGDVAAVTGPDTALVALSHVAYRSAFVLDMPAITEVAHEAGALALWDVCHSVGALPVTLDSSGADLAVGCTYKYLSGGPGAPAFLYVRSEHQGHLRQPIWGWLGRTDPFEMAQGYEPGAGVGAMLSGTPPVLALTAVAAGVELVLEAGIVAIRDKAIALTEYAIALSDEWLAPLGVTLGSPRDGARRGAHVALVHPEARGLCRRLLEAGVIVDFRPPDAIRVGLAPLSTSFADVRDGLARLRELLRAA